MKKTTWFIVSIPVIAVLVIAAFILPATQATGPSPGVTEIVSDGPADPGLPPGSAALRAWINTETGQVDVSSVPPAIKLDTQTLQALRRDTEGLQQTFHPDGSVSVHLDGRFQSVSVLRIDKNGKKVICSEHIDDIDQILRGEQTTLPQTPEVR